MVRCTGYGSCYLDEVPFVHHFCCLNHFHANGTAVPCCLDTAKLVTH